MIVSTPSPTLITIPFSVHHILPVGDENERPAAHYVEGPYYPRVFTIYKR